MNIGKENEMIEFKRSTSETKEGIISITSILNKHGKGELYFGVIFSVFVSSPPVVDRSASAVTQVWTYVGELIINMFVLTGRVKMTDRIVREMMGQ